MHVINRALRRAFDWIGYWTGCWGEVDVPSVQYVEFSRPIEWPAPRPTIHPDSIAAWLAEPESIAALPGERVHAGQRLDPWDDVDRLTANESPIFAEMVAHWSTVSDRMICA